MLGVMLTVGLFAPGSIAPQQPNYREVDRAAIRLVQQLKDTHPLVLREMMMRMGWMPKPSTTHRLSKRWEVRDFSNWKLQKLARQAQARHPSERWPD